MKRVLTAVVLIPLVIVALFKAPLWLFTLLVFGVAVLAAHEYFGIVKAQGFRPFAATGYVFFALSFGTLYWLAYFASLDYVEGSWWSGVQTPDARASRRPWAGYFVRAPLFCLRRPESGSTVLCSARRRSYSHGVALPRLHAWSVAGAARARRRCPLSAVPDAARLVRRHRRLLRGTRHRQAQARAPGEPGQIVGRRDRFGGWSGDCGHRCFSITSSPSPLYSAASHLLFAQRQSEHQFSSAAPIWLVGAVLPSA